VPFMLYDVAGPVGDRDYSLARTVQIAGTNGPLKRVHDRSVPPSPHPFGWHANGADIVAALHGSTPDQEVVIDLKPRQKGNLSLYRLRSVWGFTYEWWTPLALHLETIFVDQEVEDPQSAKARFSDHGTTRDQVGEFLYVQGGFVGGTWNWGMVGRVNGALLWSDALHYLVPRLASAVGSAGPAV